MTPREFTREYVEDHTSVDSPWTSVRSVEYAARKEKSGVDRSDIRPAVDEMLDDETLYGWFGLITLSEEELLSAIVQQEARADITRKMMVGELNTRLKSVRG